jgi:Ca2+-binding EF-hand superfamily protein
MMKKIQALLIAAMFTTTATAFADHDGMGEHCKMHTKVTFEQADKDKDGTLDREEAKAVCGEKFDVMDTDKDGTLTKEELNVCGRKKHNEHDKLHQKRSKEFAAADKDADGTLTKDEAKQLKKVYKNFEVIDADKDGTVSRDEVHDFMHKTK